MDCFESKPEVMGGKRCFAGTRVPVEQVVWLLGEGWTPDQVLAQFPSLTPEHVRAAVARPSDVGAPGPEEQAVG